MDTNKIGKCTSCGASVMQEEKQCSYCGTINTNYKEETIKEISAEHVDIGDISSKRIKGLFGGIIVAKMFKGLFNGLFGRRK